MTDDLRNGMIVMLPRLRAFARSLARSGDAADDLVQSTCEKALRAHDAWQPGTRLDSWMFRIMRNHWIDTVRRRRPETSLDNADAPDDLLGEDGERDAQSRLALADVRRMIDALPEEQRSVLVLVCVEELSYRDAADVLEVPIGTVMSRLSRARRSLHETMEGSGRAAGASGGKR